MTELDGVAVGAEVAANVLERLENSRLFAGVGSEVVVRCAGAFELGIIEAGTTIVLDAGAARNVHVVRAGSVRLELRAEPGPALVLAELGAADAFGVETLIGMPPRARYAVCVHRTVLLSAAARALQPAVASCAQFYRNVAAIIAEQLDGAAIAVRGLGCEALCSAVLAVLVRLARERGVAVADGVLLDVALGPDDVAALARAAPDDAAAALFYLERDGRIRRTGSMVTLLRRYGP